MPACSQGTPSLQELKLMYYQLLIRYHEHNNSYIDICRSYRSIYEVLSLCDLPSDNTFDTAYVAPSRPRLVS